MQSSHGIRILWIHVEIYSTKHRSNHCIAISLLSKLHIHDILLSHLRDYHPLSHLITIGGHTILLGLTDKTAEYIVLWG